jgi:hypothetical protein
MPEAIRVFLNGRGYLLPAGSVVRDALGAIMPDLLPVCETEEAFVTDGRGIPVSLETPLQAGAILRAAQRSRQGVPGELDHDAGR